MARLTLKMDRFARRGPTSSMVKFLMGVRKIV